MGIGYEPHTVISQQLDSDISEREPQSTAAVKLFPSGSDQTSNVAGGSDVA